MNTKSHLCPSDLNSSTDYLCVDCVGSNTLKTIISKHNNSNICSICDVKKITLDAASIANLVEIEIDRKYLFISIENFDNHFDILKSDFDSLVDEEYTIIDIIQKIAMVNGDAADIIQNSLYEKHKEIGNENPFHYNAYYTIKRDSYEDIKMVSWSNIKSSVVEENRFYNRKMKTVLDDISCHIEKYQIFDGESMIHHVEPYDPFFSIFRARYFDASEDLESALIEPEKELGPPPTQRANSGRMNATGVTVFYGATNPQICLAEVRPPVGSVVVIAEFEITRHIKLLDIEHLKSVYIDQDDFSNSNSRRPDKLNFIRNLNNQIIKPIVSKNTNFEYLMTQVISDYISGLSYLGFDGIIYKSSQSNSRSGKNVVLFNKSSTVQSISQRDRKNLFQRLSIIQYPIFSKSRLIRLQRNYERKKRSANDIIQEESVLKINLDSIRMSVVDGVKFDFKSDSDERVVNSPSILWK